MKVFQKQAAEMDGEEAEPTVALGIAHPTTGSTSFHTYACLVPVDPLALVMSAQATPWRAAHRQVIFLPRREGGQQLGMGSQTKWPLSDSVLP